MYIFLYFNIIINNLEIILYSILIIILDFKLLNYSKIQLEFIH